MQRLKKGNTIIELLISLVIFSIICITIYKVYSNTYERKLNNIASFSNAIDMNSIHVLFNEDPNNIKDNLVNVLGFTDNNGFYIKNNLKVQIIKSSYNIKLEIDNGDSITIWERYLED